MDKDTRSLIEFIKNKLTQQEYVELLEYLKNAVETYLEYINRRENNCNR